ncbi:MAG: phenylacetate-CoA oxygenase/reductase subunit PaaK [Betaproteobacteria bacterium]|nr:phenylacetate-CoA oxygenase/reductase subunit PaaK [Betaproteobacteria bacterium]MBK8689798.1 phenylacetate-CoA oxygenase/reductase subunit PaaK [Betaproteobacteria bacterium]MBK9674056.1 phenylacetate-CoA oxygenase/reductase subunit PaaK [Betaproteobacteria bacterium]
MSRFHRLTVTRVEPETRDAVAVTFAVPPAEAAAFRHQPGQHLTLRAIIDGEDTRRSYSICSGSTEETLRIAIKRQPGGRFSVWANEHLQAGDSLDVMPPLGHFHLPLDPAARHHYVGFAAGSGITPLLSLIRSTFAVEPRSEFTLFYGNRASASVMFREELAALKDLHLQRFTLVHVLSREAQDIELLHGRIDAGRAGQLLDHWVDLAGVDAVFVCGPEAMMDAVRNALAARGYPDTRIRIERFASSIPRVAPKAHPTPQPGHAQCVVTAIVDGATRSFPLEKGVESVLAAGLRAGVELPYSCKGGVCSTCRAKLTAGEVAMDVNFALEDYEIARGFVLTCQSHPITDAVTLDYDATA